MKPPAPGSPRPYRISCIEPLPYTDAVTRRGALERVGLNVALLDPAVVHLDLRTDSATAPRLSSQMAAMHQGSLAPETPDTHAALVDEIRSLTGKRHVAIFAQGRAAEAALADALPLAETVCVANCLFPSTRFHLERRGCKVVEYPHESLGRLNAVAPFQGEPDLAQVRAALGGASRNDMVWLELAANGAFGQPVSVGCVRGLQEAAGDRGIGLYLDATRCLENAVLLRRREPATAGLTIKAVVRRLCEPARAVTASCLKSFHAEAGGFVATDDEDLARTLEDAAIARGDGMVGAAREVLRQGIALAATDGFAEDRARQAALLHAWLQDAGMPVFQPEAAHAVFLDARRFLPHLPLENRPAKALAAALYLQSGIRVDEHFLPEALAQRGMAVVRIAVPARRYFDDQLRWVAGEVRTLHLRRGEVPGLEPFPAPPGLAGSLHTRFRLATEGVTP